MSQSISQLQDNTTSLQLSSTRVSDLQYMFMRSQKPSPNTNQRVINMYFLLQKLQSPNPILFPLNHRHPSQLLVSRGLEKVSELLPPPSLLTSKPPTSLWTCENQYSRSITLSTSQNVANARIDASEPNFKNKDRSAVVRAVVSVSDSNGNLVRKGTVTDITNE